MSNLKFLMLVLLLLAILLGNTDVFAAYYKCTNEAGETQFQSTPCASAFNPDHSTDRPLYTILVEGDEKFSRFVCRSGRQAVIARRFIRSR